MSQTMIITSESTFSNDLLDYITDEFRDEGAIFTLTLESVKEFGRFLGLSVDEYIADDLDEMVERLVDFDGLFDYLEGDEEKALLIVKRTYEKVARGVFLVD